MISISSSESSSVVAFFAVLLRFLGTWTGLDDVSLMNPSASIEESGAGGDEFGRGAEIAPFISSMPVVRSDNVLVTLDDRYLMRRYAERRWIWKI